MLIDQLKTEYINWLKQKTVFSDLSKAIEITTPFLNNNHDYVQLYAINDGDKLTITDDGSTMNELYLSGFDLASPKRKEILENIIRGYGVSLSDKGELFIECSIEQFPQKKHALLQATLKVNDMLFLNRRTVKNIFLEDVKQYLWDNTVRFTSNIGLLGKSGYHQYVDILIPASNKSGERFIQTINNLERSKVQSTLFMWDDIKSYRPSDASLYVFVNDSNKSQSDHITALKQYQVKVVTWDNRDTVIESLTA